jgi:hypothetical protein
MGQASVKPLSKEIESEFSDVNVRLIALENNTNNLEKTFNDLKRRFQTISTIVESLDMEFRRFGEKEIKKE